MWRRVQDWLLRRARTAKHVLGIAVVLILAAAAATALLLPPPAEADAIAPAANPAGEAGPIVSIPGPPDGSRLPTLLASLGWGPWSSGAPPPSRCRTGGLEGKVNLNLAGVEELDLLPGIGPTKARRIVDWRARNGPFRRIKDLRRVKGFGRKTVLKLEPHLTLDGPTTARKAGAR